ncbi:MAG TPA: hypothetical protein VJJ82_00420 [Candidatus Nanoarchaeia archaeon]|nr:hypothetical protein [Candidatus Nanoarchaeia archaeon]
MSKAPDVAKARALIEAGQKEMAYLLSLKATEEGASTIVSRVYECFHKLGQALLLKECKTGNHEDRINTLITLPVTVSRPTRALDWLRKVRQNINYNGYQASTDDLAESLSLAKTFWTPLLTEVKKKIQ